MAQRICLSHRLRLLLSSLKLSVRTKKGSVKAKGSREMATDYNRTDDILSSQQQESTSSGANNKYLGLVPKKKPLISQDHKRTFFDSADWALHKQEASTDKRTIAAIENLRPKLKRTPRKQLPPRKPTFASGQENQTHPSF